MGEEFPQGQEPVPENQQWGMISPEMSEQMDQVAQQASGLSQEEYNSRLEQQKQNLQSLNVSTERSEPVPESETHTTQQIEVVEDEPAKPEQEQETGTVQEMEHKVNHGESAESSEQATEKGSSEQHDESERVQDPDFAHEMALKEAPLQEMLSRLKNNSHVPESIRKRSMEDLTREIQDLERQMEMVSRWHDKVVGDHVKTAVVNIKNFAIQHPKESALDYDEILGSDAWTNAWYEIEDVTNMFTDNEPQPGEDLENGENNFRKAGRDISETVKALVGAQPTPNVRFNTVFDGQPSFFELYETENGTLVVQNSDYINPNNGTIRRVNCSTSLTQMSPDQFVKLYEKEHLDDGEHFNLTLS